jgi:hypothetical protein
MFNVNTFKTMLHGGGARPNLFKVSIGGMDNGFEFMCKAANIPASTIASVDVNYMGRILKVPGNRTYEDWTVTIINDENWRIRSKFEKWMEVINSPEGNLQNDPIGVALATNIYQDGFVEQLGKNGLPVAGYNFINLFPTEIEAIDLNWGTNDEIEEFTVTFAYDLWEGNSISLNSKIAGAVQQAAGIVQAIT